MSSTATDSALATTELLGHIFYHCSVSQNYRNALVCKTWCDEALSDVWCELKSLLPLLSLLAPLALCAEEGMPPLYRFRHHIRPHDWAVFRKYSWRVRAIDDTMTADYCESVFIDIVASSPPLSSELLPNLRRWKYDRWGALVKFIPLFIHSTLTTFHLCFMNQDAGGLPLPVYRRTLLYVSDKAPNLERLSLTSWSPLDTNTEFAIHSLLSSLTRLQILLVSPTLLSALTLNAIARLPHLKSLTVSSETTYKKLAVPMAAPTESFPSLKTLSSYDMFSFGTVTDVLNAYRPRSLSDLDITSRHKENISAYSLLVAAVTSVSPNIRSIRLRSKEQWDINDPELDHSSAMLFLSIDYHCFNLTSLSLQNPPPLHLGIEIMTDLLKSLPYLKTLQFNESTGPPTLRLSALPILAPLCPLMKTLTLYMDTKGVSCSGPQGAHFVRLETLNVGMSPLDSPAHDVAVFLSTVLPKACTLTRASYAYPEEQYQSWQQVIDILPML
ncbi:hypothetical protein PC9H_008844 [Pleurotus ostreatus]|uniref:F-box domain-containing protein n=1 Tax=Pleurotus ostreatus TaxID=5322 RepID=A0A8H6ZWK1_PLEOS|nr:uncharacterized protein PC9H_008844 [Pleurotus ostreatus]KAF7426475.1 hypothetical protein PC9H_008844 [Pleurotus ostreatus]KAJ8694025.1 hypothetical protein PTI98_008958 [Pleurotus ostreatus]